MNDIAAAFNQFMDVLRGAYGTKLDHLGDFEVAELIAAGLSTISPDDAGTAETAEFLAVVFDEIARN